MTASTTSGVGPIAIVAPGGRDAAVIDGILRSADVSCCVTNLSKLIEEFASGRFSAALVAEEALAGIPASTIAQAIDHQPPWSDFPFIVLTWRGRPNASYPAIQAMRNVTEVERPVHPATLLGTVRSAMRARARQHETAAHLAARHEAEAELRRLAQTLEGRVAERTQELVDANERLQSEMRERSEAEARVRSMQAQLIHISRLSAMDTMGSTIAHELNQPLAAIVNYMRGVERLLTDVPDLPEDLVAVVSAVAANAHRAGTIIRRLRDLVQHRSVVRQPESFSELFEEAQVLGLIDSSVRGVECHLHVAPGTDRVLVDRVQIQQVLINLIRNAVEAMEGSVQREITITTGRADNGNVAIEVADTGPGLPASLLAAEFSPFKTTKSGGLGIGLSICRTILEDHGGCISARNGPAGAIIRFELLAAAAL